MKQFLLTSLFQKFIPKVYSKSLFQKFIPKVYSKSLFQKFIPKVYSKSLFQKFILPVILLFSMSSVASAQFNLSEVTEWQSGGQNGCEQIILNWDLSGEDTTDAYIELPFDFFSFDSIVWYELPGDLGVPNVSINTIGVPPFETQIHVDDYYDDGNPALGIVYLKQIAPLNGAPSKVKHYVKYHNQTSYARE